MPSKRQTKPRKCAIVLVSDRYCIYTSEDGAKVCPRPALADRHYCLECLVKRSDHLDEVADFVHECEVTVKEAREQVARANAEIDRLSAPSLEYQTVEAASEGWTNVRISETGCTFNQVANLQGLCPGHAVEGSNFCLYHLIAASDVYDTVKTELARCSTENAELQRHVKESESAMRDAADALSQAKTLLDAYKADLERHKANKERLQSELNTETSNVDRLLSDKKDLTDKNIHLAATNTNLKEVIAKRDARITELECDLENSHTCRQSVVSDLRESQSEYRGYRRAIGETFGANIKGAKRG